MPRLGPLNIEDVLGRKSIHPFPARMAPGLALETISKLRRGSTVLDPMIGSGTVAAIARSNGHRAIGFDVDPLAALTAGVWTRTVNPEAARLTARRVFNHATQLTSRATLAQSFPVGADLETRRFMRYWFDVDARKELVALAVVIGRVRQKAIRELLWCAFSRQIITKKTGASRAMDLAHSRPHRYFDRAPRRPLKNFLFAVETVLAGCLQAQARNRGPSARIRIGDVRHLPIANHTVDLVFTSPPYLNAIDYLRCSKFSLIWMGYSIEELRVIRSGSIGAEHGVEVSDRHAKALARLRLQPTPNLWVTGILGRYIDDTFEAIKELKRVLAPHGQIVFVIGENTLRGTFIPTAKLVVHLANECGLHLKERRVRCLPNQSRYLPPPGNQRNSLKRRMGREVILTFSRAKRSAKRR